MWKFLSWFSVFCGIAFLYWGFTMETSLPGLNRQDINGELEELRSAYLVFGIAFLLGGGFGLWKTRRK